MSVGPTGNNSGVTPFWALAGTEAGKLLNDKNAAGKPKVVDVVMAAVDFGLWATGQPPLPKADKDLAKLGIETLLLQLAGETETITSAAKIANLKAFADKALPRITEIGATVTADAGDNLSLKLLGAAATWVAKNPTESIALGMNIAETIGNAITSGGTSLVADLPGLAVAAMTAAAGVLAQAGFKPEDLAAKAATDLLKFLGVPEAEAVASGKSLGNIAVLGLNVGMSIASGGTGATTDSGARFNLGLGNVNNTSDANKPVSTLTQAALDLKAPLVSPTFTGTVSGLTKAMVSLGNVENLKNTLNTASTPTMNADSDAGYAAGSATPAPWPAASRRSTPRPPKRAWRPWA